jgi:catechol 2,3-dioxygenase-like lactoylglutathione lyase family enzyme/ketosteroid isomerase-like protein
VPELAIDRLDHLVLTVHDLAATCRFYERVLGMEVVRFGRGRLALRFGRQKINLHPASPGESAGGVTNAIRLVAADPTPGSADFCLLTEAPLDRWIAHLEACGVPLVEGPGPRSGAEGPILSIYFRDPDGNLVEVSNEAERAADPIAPLRQWLRDLSNCVRAVDFEGGRRLCAPEMFAFGTVAEFVEGLEAVMDAQWRRVWPHIRDFRIRADEARGGIAGDHGWVAAPWDSRGVRPDGSTFPRPGRLTIIFERRGGRWLATHTHFSLSPSAGPAG